MDEVLFGWYRRLSLRTRFTVLITASLVVLFAALVPAVVYLERRAVLEGAWERGLQLTKIFAHASVQGLVANDFLVVRHVINSVASEPDVLYAMIVDPKGRILAHSDVRQRGQIASDPLAERAIAAESPLGQEVFDPQPQGLRVRRADLRAAQPGGGRPRRDLPRTGARPIIRQYVQPLHPASGRWPSSRASEWRRGRHGPVTRPLGELVRGARVSPAGNLADRISTQGADEVAQLGEAFNGMARALQTRIEELKSARDESVRKTRLAAIGEIAAVMAHETRNPLGALSNCAQILRKHAPLSAENAELLEHHQDGGRPAQHDRLRLPGLRAPAEPHFPAGGPSASRSTRRWACCAATIGARPPSSSRRSTLGGAPVRARRSQSAPPGLLEHPDQCRPGHGRQGHHHRRDRGEAPGLSARRRQRHGLRHPPRRCGPPVRAVPDAAGGRHRPRPGHGAAHRPGRRRPRLHAPAFPARARRSWSRSPMADRILDRRRRAGDAAQPRHHAAPRGLRRRASAADGQAGRRARSARDAVDLVIADLRHGRAVGARRAAAR